MHSEKWSPEFDKIDLLALYTIMYLKLIIINKFSSKEHLETLIEEIELNMEKLGKEKMKYFLSTTRDYSRVYCSQWSVTNYGIEVGQPTFSTLLLVLSLRLGLEKFWVPDSSLYREDILIDDYLSQKPVLQLTSLSTGEPHFAQLVPLCPRLIHISMPYCDNALFMKIVQIKSLRILEFTLGVADKVLCQALWNFDRKSEKVLQLVLKEKKEGSVCSVALPHLEVLRSNICQKDSGANSMKVTLGAVALAMQPKLRVVENEKFWSTLQAVSCLLQMEKKYKVARKRLLAVDKFFIDPYYCNGKDLTSQIREAYAICPAISDLTFTHSSANLQTEICPLIKCVAVQNIEKLTLDISLIPTEKDLYDLLSPFVNVKYLTLKVSTAFIKKFYPHERDCPPGCHELMGNWISGRLLPHLKSLSLVLWETRENSNIGAEESEYQLSTAMISFLYWFGHAIELKLYNILTAPPCYVVYGCVGGALGVMTNLKHLSLIGHTKIFPSSLWLHSFMEGDSHIHDLLPKLLDEPTFDIMRTLKTFEIDEVFVNEKVDAFLDILRACDVYVKVSYRPLCFKGLDPVKYQTLNSYEYCESDELLTEGS